MATVTEADRAAAGDLFHACTERQFMTNADEFTVEAIAQAIADARERGARECYVDVCALRCTAHGGEDGCPCLAAAEQAIAARRSP